MGASLVLGSAGAVAADTPATYFVDTYSCAVTDIDNNFVDPTAIPAGSEIVAWEGWLATKRGQLLSFLNNVTWILSANGTMVDVPPLLDGPYDFGFAWGVFFSVSVGTIGAGQTITIHYDHVLKSSNFDGVFHYSKGSLYNGGIDCSVTGV